MSKSEKNNTDIISKLKLFQEKFEAVRNEIAKVMVGHHDKIENLLVAIFSGGNILLTGVPGLGRTFLVNSLAKVLGLSSNRIQFTPDLLPTDIVGSEVLETSEQHERRFRFFKGPIFCNLLLADEINRSPARTQSALLEAMHERQVTIGGKTHFLPKPFVVIATRNNLETEGVWQMPEAQIDRFMVSIELTYPSEADETELMWRTTGQSRTSLNPVIGAEDILEMQKIAAAIPVVPAVKRFAVDIVRCTRPGAGAPEDLVPIIRLGASPRAAQSILRGSKVLAIVRGRSYVTREDIKTTAYPVLEHRLMLDFRAVSRGIKSSDVVDRLIDAAETSRIPDNAYISDTRHVLKPMV